MDCDYEKSKIITSNTSIKNIKDFIAIDVETTGIKISGNHIIEVSAIKFENFEPVEIFTTLCKSPKNIPSEATEINGISDEMVADKPMFQEICNSLKEYISDYPLVFHNARFDIRFLFVGGLDIDFSKAKIYDTLELSRKCIKDYEGNKLDSYKLADVCSECSIYFENAHRSGTDALATGLLFNEIVKIKKDCDDLTTLL